MAEPDQSICPCCNEPIMSGIHACKTCKVDVHSHILCTRVWMPQDSMYFCSKACIEKHNGSDEVADCDKVPLRRRPHTEEEEPDAQTGTATRQTGPVQPRKKGVEITAAAKRPRRANAAATGAPPKPGGMMAFFKPVDSPNKAAGQKTAAKGRAPVGQPTLQAAVMQQRFARAPGQTEGEGDLPVLRSTSTSLSAVGWRLGGYGSSGSDSEEVAGAAADNNSVGDDNEDGGGNKRAGMPAAGAKKSVP